MTIREEIEPVPCESVTTCTEPSAFVLTNRDGQEFRLCPKCAGSYFEAGDE